MSGVANGSGQSVGRVIGARLVIEPEQLFDHVLDLGFFSRTRSHDRQLDLPRRELPHGKPALGTGDERSAARLTRGERGGDVLADQGGAYALARGRVDNFNLDVTKYYFVSSCGQITCVWEGSGPCSQQ